MAGFSTLAPPVFPSGTASSDWYGLCCFLAYFLCFPNSFGIESWCSVCNILSFPQCYLPLSPCNFHPAGTLPSCIPLAHSVFRQSIAGWVPLELTRVGLFLNFWISYLPWGLYSSHVYSQVRQELWIPLQLWSGYCWRLSDPRPPCGTGVRERVWRGCWGGTSSGSPRSAELLPEGQQMASGVSQELMFLNQSRNSQARHRETDCPLPSSPHASARSSTPWKASALSYCIIYL